MSRFKEKDFGETDDFDEGDGLAEGDEEMLAFEVGRKTHKRTLDDGLAPDDLLDPALQARMSGLLDTITRIGGEVCRLRADMDGLLDQNTQLLDQFARLKEVIEEKGSLDLDDFELACDVLSGSPFDPSGTPNPSKKIAH